MIVQTKFHDISFEELRTRHHAGSCTREEWAVRRNQPVRIIVPALDGLEWFCEEDRALAAECGGPHFTMADSPKLSVCPHTVEVGD